jgi:hypothetical protein
MKIRMRLTGFPLSQAARGMPEIRPYFFPLGCACMSEDANVFVGKTGWRREEALFWQTPMQAGGLEAPSCRRTNLK